MGTKKEPVTGAVLFWAIDESGYSLAEVASRLEVSESDLQDWIEEVSQPTVGQLTKLAKYLKRPRLLFFLPHPPEETTPSQFRRAATQTGFEPLSPAERLILRRARRIQGIVSSLIRLDTSGPISIPRATVQDDPVAVAATLRKWVAPFNYSDHQQFDQWRKEFQERGILVLTLPVRQRNRSTPSSLRGFALSDPFAPAIAVSTADNYSARSFTLFHELAHLATDTTQSCGPIVAPSELPQVFPDVASERERWCDAVAGNALIPQDELHEIVLHQDGDDLRLVQQVAVHFKVSFRAAAVSLIQANAIPDMVYGEVVRKWPLLDREKDVRGAEGGRTRSQIRVDEWGGKAIRTIFEAYDRHQVSELNLRRWLDMAGLEIDEARELAQVSG